MATHPEIAAVFPDIPLCNTPCRHFPESSNASSSAMRKPTLPSRVCAWTTPGASSATSCRPSSAPPGINVGELLEVTGEWEKHPQHGRDLRVASFVSHAPVSATGLKRYLGSGVIKASAPRPPSASSIHFGEQTLAILELEPERLTEVSGISATKRDAIVAGWAEQHEIRD